MDALRGGLLGHGGSDALAQLLVPGVGHGNGGGEAGCRHGAVETQVVGLARLVTHAAGAVGELERGDALVGQRPASEGRLALEELALFLKRELSDDVCVFHRCPFAQLSVRF